MWTLVLQGVAQHVADNAVALQPRFVAHAGKKTLDVACDNFVPGGHNDWAGAFEGEKGFAEQIRQNTVPGTVELMETNFSSTTPAEAVCGIATTMSALQSFFDYSWSSCCGFPSITLEGTPGDWEALRCRAEKLIGTKCLAEFADSWLPALLPVLDRFVQRRNESGPVDVQFWQSFCKRGGKAGSGGYTWMNGWFNVFFPGTVAPLAACERGTLSFLPRAPPGLSKTLPRTCTHLYTHAHICTHTHTHTYTHTHTHTVLGIWHHMATCVALP